MTRRMIDSSLWSNEHFAELPPMARLLLIGIINHADDQGRVKAHPAYLRSIIFPYDDVTLDDIDAFLCAISDNGTLQVFQVEGKFYAQLLNWWDYQSLQYAAPSEYPRPANGWRDRIRYNAKGNMTLTCNWHTVNGDLLDDTCDQNGKPLPIVATLPPRNPGGRPPKNSPENPGEKVAGNPGENPGEKVNRNISININKEEEERGEGGYAATPPAAHEVDVAIVESQLKPGQLYYRTICEILGWDYKTLPAKNRVQVAEAVKKLMAAEYTCEERERFMGEVWVQDWRWKKKKQRPTLEEFQAEVGKLRSGPVEGKRSYNLDDYFDKLPRKRYSVDA